MQTTAGRGRVALSMQLASRPGRRKAAKGPRRVRRVEACAGGHEEWIGNQTVASIRASLPFALRNCASPVTRSVTFGYVAAALSWKVMCWLAADVAKRNGERRGTVWPQSFGRRPLAASRRDESCCGTGGLRGNCPPAGRALILNQTQRPRPRGCATRPGGVPAVWGRWMRPFRAAGSSFFRWHVRLF